MKLFSESEAWLLFKVTAIGEAGGWALLLYGIASQHYHLPGSLFMLPIGGSIHGIIFLGYLGVVIAGFPSLGWSLRKAAFAVFLSIVPFATLVFEMREERARDRLTRTSFRRIAVNAIIRKKDTLLAIQPSSGVAWHVPGGYVAAGETPPAALVRFITELTGVEPTIGALLYMQTARRNHEDQLELYFMITNASEFNEDGILPHVQEQMAADAIDYVDPLQVPEFEPAFLRGVRIKDLPSDGNVILLPRS
ncbi:MAG TPA: DUF3817 domain-containing protein [Candidatus Saccharimonadia bacterium]|nr:DUF3817 domain-containing protein [Candidatus Saccharimonadia bacterium]